MYSPALLYHHIYSSSSAPICTILSPFPYLPPFASFTPSSSFACPLSITLVSLSLPLSLSVFFLHSFSLLLCLHFIFLFYVCAHVCICYAFDSAYLFNCLFVCDCLCVYLIHMSVYMHSINTSLYLISIYLSAFRYTCLPVCLSAQAWRRTRM